MRSGLVIGVASLLLAACHRDACPANTCTAPTLIGIALSPTGVVLAGIDGSRPSQAYALFERWSDGHTSPATGASFEIMPPTLGRIDPATLVLTANGRVAGAGVLRARLGAWVVTASLAVELSATAIGNGVAPSDVVAFAAATPIEGASEAVTVVYPLNGVVMPQNAPPPTIQWRGGQAGDVLRIRWSKPGLDYAAYVKNEGPGFQDAYAESLGTWRAIALSTPGEPATLHVDRLTNGRLYVSGPIRVRFAEAALEGVIYYRNVTPDRMLAIENRASTPRSVLPDPPLGCAGCHTLSGNGRYLSARFGTIEDEGGVYDLTGDLTSTAAAPVMRLRAPWWFSTFSPDNRRILVTLDELGAGGMALYDLGAGIAIAPLEGSLPTGLVSHPAWSPDGGAIAYLANLDAWGGYNTTGDLWLMPVLGLDRFAAPVARVRGDAPELQPGRAISYPTWSPDSRLLAFAHGTSAQSATGTSALYLIHRNEGAPVRLDGASGGPGAWDTFAPRFAPSHQGGYYWLCYLSRRDYGNAKAGTAGTGRQQIWVSAIKDTVPDGVDPSEVGYWLEGQDIASPNITAYWAPRACRADAEICGRDQQCCSDACDPSGHCASRTEACASLSATCRSNVDCCDGVRCIDERCGGIE